MKTHKVKEQADKFAGWKRKIEAQKENQALQDLKRQAYEEQMYELWFFDRIPSKIDEKFIYFCDFHQKIASRNRLARRMKAEEVAKAKKADEARQHKKKFEKQQIWAKISFQTHKSHQQRCSKSLFHWNFWNENFRCQEAQLKLEDAKTKQARLIRQQKLTKFTFLLRFAQ